jgi:hypothetical protein
MAKREFSQGPMIIDGNRDEGLKWANNFKLNASEVKVMSEN